MEAPKGVISKVSGPLVVARGMENVKLFDVVLVSDKKLIGEIVEIRSDKASIQVYEDTAGLGPGEPVYTTNHPLMAELGPGLIESIYDGIQRPLEGLFKATGEYIERGVQVPALNREKKWEFKAVLEKGVHVKGGDILGKVQETILIEHKVMVPPKIEGELIEIKSGQYTIEEVIAKVKTKTGETV
ncbi:MAG: V-type ATP synthase subunit A, partial [Candidatus Muirbacterium halophilum]|nr:V-type ATP synthase subunit A [Candidatus Muirbacterium halophilum]